MNVDCMGSGDSTQYRIFYQDGHVSHHPAWREMQQELHELPPHCKVATRGIGDDRPVFSTDYYDERST